MISHIDAATGFELRREFHDTTDSERREQIIVEFGKRQRLRKSLTGHDRSLCDHPNRCILVGPQRAPKESQDSRAAE